MAIIHAFTADRHLLPLQHLGHEILTVTFIESHDGTRKLAEINKAALVRIDVLEDPLGEALLRNDGGAGTVNVHAVVEETASESAKIRVDLRSGG